VHSQRGRYAAFAVFFALPAAFGAAFTSAFFFAAHRRRILSEAASLWAALNLRRFFFAGLVTSVGTAAASVFLGGLPWRFVGPWRASMAAWSLSLSAISKATICSVGIKGNRNTVDAAGIVLERSVGLCRDSATADDLIAYSPSEWKGGPFLPTPDSEGRLGFSHKEFWINAGNGYLANRKLTMVSMWGPDILLKVVVCLLEI
jgi:hypothetical protein